MKGHYLMYNQDTLIKVARIIKPEGELTDEDLEKAKEYINNVKD
jgi:hypothetical protein